MKWRKKKSLQESPTLSRPSAKVDSEGKIAQGFERRCIDDFRKQGMIYNGFPHQEIISNRSTRTMVHVHTCCCKNDPSMLLLQTAGTFPYTLAVIEMLSK
ncbi:OLC1v1013975C1 [Oldenlandia corymbosa var. corymbosa]|uniref:OLC1v1013975C1 n=1 Tax=Oldenlandia corymbosa var. corymbosa TaxID=529605 RepID=A0AAV1E379_OLDCO|nr:OLC1v1013975C1 [Oldenlandia corymbosa var. corymbosa]